MVDRSNLNPAFSPLLNAYLAALDKAGIKYTLDSAYRSTPHQQEIWERSKQGTLFPAAPPGRSFHNFGLAADVIATNPADYPRMHEIAASVGLAPANAKKGWDWDRPHVELPGTLDENIAKYNLANFAPSEAGYTGAPVGTTITSTPAFDAAGWRNPTDVTLPMGMGNNNPANIKYYEGSPYGGVVGPSKNTDQGDPQFVFDTPASGMAAAHGLLGRKYAAGMTTPAMIIAGPKGWTPGNMQAAENVAKSAGIGVNDDIGYADSAKAQKFLAALIKQEQGAASSYYPTGLYASTISGGTAAPVTGPGDASIRARSGTDVPIGGTAPAAPTAPAVAMGAAPGGAAPPEFAKTPVGKSLDELAKATTPDQQQQPQFLNLPSSARNVSPYLGGQGALGSGQNVAMAQMQQALGYQPTPVYGTGLTSLPPSWSGATPGSPTQNQPQFGGFGPQTSPYGTSIGSIDPMLTAMLQRQQGLAPPQGAADPYGGFGYG